MKRGWEMGNTSAAAGWGGEGGGRFPLLIVEGVSTGVGATRSGMRVGVDRRRGLLARRIGNGDDDGCGVNLSADSVD